MNKELRFEIRKVICGGRICKECRIDAELPRGISCDKYEGNKLVQYATELYSAGDECFFESLRLSKYKKEIMVAMSSRGVQYD